MTPSSASAATTIPQTFDLQIMDRMFEYSAATAATSHLSPFRATLLHTGNPKQ
jgi:hypothetical protein